MTHEQHDIRGMTLNERLYVTGLLDEFDRARQSRDRERIIALLGQVEVRGADAEWIADEILRPWWRTLLTVVRGRHRRR